MGLKSAFKALFSKEKPRDPRQNHDFTQEDSDLGVEIRRMRQESKLIREKMQLMEQKKELNDLKAELEDLEDQDEEEDEQTTILNYLAPILANLQQKPQQNHQNMSNHANSMYAPPTNAAKNITDDDIRAFLAKQDRKILKIAKTMPKEVLIRRSIDEMKTTPQEAERAYEILMEEF